MLYEIGQGGLKPLSNAGKDNLAIGTVLQLNGYSNPKYVIIKNLGVDTRWGYGARYVCLNMTDGGETQKEAATLRFLSEKQDNRIQTYITDEILSADQVLDFWEKSQAAKLVAQAEVQKKADAKAAGIAMLPSMYPLLIQKKDSGKTYAATAGINIRIELKAAFPGVKFKVVSENYSMGSSVNVSWVDGPTVDDVKKITNKYEQGSFDGMTDCYDYKDEIFTDIFGGAKYVFENRKQVA